MTTTHMTNRAFGEAIGVTDSYASYLRNGQKLPSAVTLIHIVFKFKLDPIPVMTAYLGGKEAFGEYLRTQVFDVEAEDEHPEPVTAGAP